MQTDPAFTSALELRRAILRKEISPVEVVTASVARMEAHEPLLNCFVTRTPEIALEAARTAEAAILAGDDPGALGGLPISVKDLIAVGGVRLTFGSRTIANNIASADAPSVERVKAAGACTLGKTTTPEFGCKGTGDSPRLCRAPRRGRVRCGGGRTRPGSRGLQGRRDGPRDGRGSLRSLGVGVLRRSGHPPAPASRGGA